MQSVRFHTGQDAWERTMQVTSELSACLGLVVVQIRPLRIRTEPAAVLGRLEQAYLEAVRRGRRAEYLDVTERYPTRPEFRNSR